MCIFQSKEGSHDHFPRSFEISIILRHRTCPVTGYKGRQRGLYRYRCCFNMPQQLLRGATRHRCLTSPPTERVKLDMLLIAFGEQGSGGRVWWWGGGPGGEGVEGMRRYGCWFQLHNIMHLKYHDDNSIRVIINEIQCLNESKQRFYHKIEEIAKLRNM